MNNSIEIQFHLPVQISKKEKWYVAAWPVLDVYSLGDSQENAKANLAEALTLFLQSCFERGTLDAILKECGFTPLATPIPSEVEFVNIPLHFRQTAPHPQIYPV